jgi:hypothetical protein
MKNDNRKTLIPYLPTIPSEVSASAAAVSSDLQLKIKDFKLNASQIVLP